MNREKSTGKKAKLHLKLTLIALVLFSIILNACPPMEEDQFSNVLIYDGPLDLVKWMDILNDIFERGIPVNLDLSACTVPDYGADVLKRTHQNGESYTLSTAENELDDYIQFDPFPGFPYGKGLIRTLILPKAATMIKNATDIDITLITDEEKDKSAFRYFTDLRSITGENIRLIGTLAFIDCKSLEKANFDSAVRIMQYAFYGCTSLKEAHFEVARYLNISSFENCVNLEKAVFPDAGVILERAFKNCGRLTEINFDIATTIGAEAFRDCTGLKYARFRANPDHITEGHPLQPYIDGGPTIFVSDSVVFYNNAFRGCKSLEILDIRYAWNVYFAGGALADIGEHLELFLFDDDGTKSFGHPQTDMFLGDIEESEEKGGVTLKTLLIRAPAVTPPEDSQIIIDSAAPGMAGIKSYINSTYNGDSDRDENNEPLHPLVRVIVQEY